MPWTFFFNLGKVKILQTHSYTTFLNKNPAKDVFSPISAMVVWL